jgi:predicted aspartyl protease
MAWRKIRTIVAASALLFAGAMGSGLGGAPANTKTKVKLDANSMSMEVVDGYFIVVRASVGDRRDLNFLLDTGATTSAIDSKLAERLGLATRASQMVSFDKTVRVEWCVLPELAYGRSARPI